MPPNLNIGHMICSYNKPHTQYHAENWLGEGSFDAVYVIKRRRDNQRFAMKVIDTDDFSHHYYDDDRDPEAKMTAFREEATMLMRLNHRYIVKLENVGWDRIERVHCLIMDYATGGSLQSFYFDIPEHLIETTAQVVANQMLDALQYLHSRRPNAIIHKDIKPGNILVFHPSHNTITFKLADFGISEMLDDDEDMIQLEGDPTYMAPEMAHCSVERGLEDRCDVYSLGLVLRYILTGQINGDQRRFTDDFALEGCDIIQAMTREQACQRPRVKACRQNSWVREGASMQGWKMRELCQAGDVDGLEQQTVITVSIRYVILPTTPSQSSINARRS